MLERMTPEQIHMSRLAQDQQFLRGGAKLEIDPGTEQTRIHLTDAQLARLNAENETIAELKSNRPKTETRMGGIEFIQWMQANHYTALSYIVNELGGFDQFVKKAEAAAKNRLAEKTEQPKTRRRNTPLAA